MSLCCGRIQGQEEDHSQELEELEELEERVLLYEMECARNVLLLLFLSLSYLPIYPQNLDLRRHTIHFGEHLTNECMNACISLSS